MSALLMDRSKLIIKYGCPACGEEHEFPLDWWTQGKTNIALTVRCQKTLDPIASFYLKVRAGRSTTISTDPPLAVRQILLREPHS